MTDRTFDADLEALLRAADPATAEPEAARGPRAESDLAGIVAHRPPVEEGRQARPVAPLRRRLIPLLAAAAAAAVIATGAGIALTARSGLDADAYASALEASDPPIGISAKIAIAPDIATIDDWTDTEFGGRVTAITPITTGTGFTWRLATVEVLGATEGDAAAGDTVQVALRDGTDVVSDWPADPELAVGETYAFFVSAEPNAALPYYVAPALGQGLFAADGAGLPSAQYVSELRLDPAALSALGL
jgi:hypothetical protein